MRDQSREMDVCNNRKARFNYTVLDTIECGIVLYGPEVKSLRQHLASLDGSYAVVRDGEVWMVGCHIEEYKNGKNAPHPPKRDRKLMIQKRQIGKFAEEAKIRGQTLVPLRIYFSGGWAKVELALCQGKQTHDKRASIKDRDMKRAAQRGGE